MSAYPRYQPQVDQAGAFSCPATWVPLGAVKTWRGDPAAFLGHQLPGGRRVPAVQPEVPAVEEGPEAHAGSTATAARRNHRRQVAVTLRRGDVWFAAAAIALGLLLGYGYAHYFG